MTTDPNLIRQNITDDVANSLENICYGRHVTSIVSRGLGRGLYRRACQEIATLIRVEYLSDPALKERSDLSKKMLLNVDERRTNVGDWSQDSLGVIGPAVANP